MSKFSWIIWLFVLFACGESKKEGEKDTVKDGNKSVTLSSDISRLSKLINFVEYKPIRAKFKYTYFDNSGHSERLSIPGPSARYLEAVIYFDRSTFNKLKVRHSNVNFPAPIPTRKDFDFEWLDNDIKNELLQSDSTNHRLQSNSFGFGFSGSIWFLCDKILLHGFAN